MAVLKPLLPADAVVCTDLGGSIGQAGKDLGLEHHPVVTSKGRHAIGVLRASLAAPDPLRARYRQALNELMQFVVFYGRTLEDAFSEVPVDAADLAALRAIANTELDHLEQYNCARYNLARGMTQRGIDARRPR